MMYVFFVFIFFFQEEDGIRDLVRSRGLGDVYKRQATGNPSQDRVQMIDTALRMIVSWSLLSPPHWRRNNPRTRPKKKGKKATIGTALSYTFKLGASILLAMKYLIMEQNYPKAKMIFLFRYYALGGYVGWLRKA